MVFTNSCDRHEFNTFSNMFEKELDLLCCPKVQNIQIGPWSYNNHIIYSFKMNITCLNI